MKFAFHDLCAKNDKGLPALKNVSLEIREGEILGLAGVDGNGQKELCEVLTGLRRADAGTLTLNGENVTNLTPRGYIDRKISHIPEDRHTTGLALDWSLKRNLVLKSFRTPPYAKYGLMQLKAIDAFWKRAKDEYQIKAIDGDETARALSGGNQQKVILAREIDGDPEVLITPITATLGTGCGRGGVCPRQTSGGPEQGRGRPGGLRGSGRAATDLRPDRRDLRRRDYGNFASQRGHLRNRRADDGQTTGGGRQ